MSVVQTTIESDNACSYVTSPTANQLLLQDCMIETNRCSNVACNVYY